MHVRSWNKVRSGGLGAKLIESIMSRDIRACRYCGSSDRLGVDHVIPRKRGGTDSAENIVVACRKCNARKQSRTPEEAGMALLTREQHRRMAAYRRSVRVLHLTQ